MLGEAVQITNRRVLVLENEEKTRLASAAGQAALLAGEAGDASPSP
jgi:hypothetical protein